MKASEVWSAANALRKLRLGLLLAGCVVALAGCENKGCFGLCDLADEDDESMMDPDPDPGLDLSCYRTGTLEDVRTPVAYDAEAEAEQLLHFYPASSASSTNPRPVLVWVTGNTWQLGTSPTGNLPTIVLAIARRLDASVAAVGYRQSDTARWPAQIIDVKTAIRFLRGENDRLQFNIDVDQVYIGGDQAGATLAALAAYAENIDDFNPPTLFPNQRDDVSLLITLGGMHDFESILADNDARPASCATIDPNIDALAIRRLFDCDEAAAGADPLSECDLNEMREASPIQYVGAGQPRALFYHGAMDCQIPVAQSTALDAAFGDTDDDTILRGRARFTSFADDTNALESLTSQLVLEDLVGFDDFDCDDAT